MSLTEHREATVLKSADPVHCPLCGVMTSRGESWTTDLCTLHQKISDMGADAQTSKQYIDHLESRIAAANAILARIFNELELAHDALEPEEP